MTGRGSFDDALDAAIDALSAGRPLDLVLGDFPSHAAALRPMLETTLQATHERGGYVPPSPRLAEHVMIVRAAAQRAEMAARVAPSSARPMARGGWRQRRLTFASLSLPAGIALLVALGAGSAAAASIAATTNLPSQVAGIVTSGWAEDFVPGINAHGGKDDSDAAVGGDDNTETPGDRNRPTFTEAEGLVSDAHGNTFTLTSGEGSWTVQIDDNTNVAGDIADGAMVTVSGDVTAEKNLHADDVEVTSPAPTATPDEGGPSPDKTPGPSDKTPGPPEKTPKAEKTVGPPDNDTPPGGGNGQGSPEASSSNDEGTGDGAAGPDDDGTDSPQP